MTRRTWGIAVLGTFLAAQACDDGIPTASDGGLLPVDAVTLEVRLPFESFATDFQRFEGYGSPSFIPGAALAHQWGGEVEARALIRFGDLPRFIFVFPPGANATTVDSLYHPVGGKLTLRFDTLVVEGTPPFLVSTGLIQSSWHPTSVSWEFAVDTVGNRVPWAEPGAGPLLSIGEGAWTPTRPPPDPEDGEQALENTLEIAFDSIQAVAWAAAAPDAQGFWVAGGTPDSRLRVTAALLTVDVRSSVNPDTVVAVPITPFAITYIADPGPNPDPEFFTIGGAPATRATMRMALPATVPGSPEVCALVACPLELLPERLVYAGIELYSHEADPIGLRPLAPIAIEVRPVLSPERLPRSPLGQPIACPTNVCSMVLPSTLVEEAFFSSDPGTRVVLPITRYVRDLLRPGGTFGATVPTTLALMNALDDATGLEMRDLQYASFWAPGTDLAPTLRLVLTVSKGVPTP